MAQKKLLNMSLKCLIFVPLIQILHYFFSASDMALHANSDVSYLSLPKTRSRARRHYYLSDLSYEPPKVQTTAPKSNRPVFTVCHILRHIMTSSTEVEIATLFKNDPETVVLRNILINLRYSQPATTIKRDVSMVVDISTNTILQRKLHATDMECYWLHDWLNQGQFIGYRRAGVHNLGSYHTK